MPVNEYDFLTWTSFPSSRKMTNETDQQIWWEAVGKLVVQPGKKLTVTIKGKGEHLIIHPITQLGTSHIAVDGVDVAGALRRLFNIVFPVGTFDWTEFKENVTISSDVIALRVTTIAGPGLVAQPSVTWFDDLKIYQDDVLIYADDFSNWAPIIIPAQIVTGVAMIKYLK